MILYSLEIPEAPAGLASWLEGHLVGVHLVELAAELTAANGPGPDGPPWPELFGDRAEAVLVGGLSVLTHDQLREILRRPARLLELQEWILIEGGPYWQRLVDATPAPEEIARVAARLERSLSGGGTSRPTPSPDPWHRRPWFVALATAACVLVAVSVLRPFASTGPTPLQGVILGERKPTAPIEGAATSKPPLGAAIGWGWDRPDALPQDVPARAYLEGLAGAAKEWAKVRPENRQALGKRLVEFRSGCSTLILATHAPLGERDQIWLRDRCREWAAKITEALTDLENDGDLDSVRTQVSGIVADMVKKLEDRAKKA